jgi:hypothetical protein
VYQTSHAGNTETQKWGYGDDDKMYFDYLLFFIWGLGNVIAVDAAKG